MGRLRVIVKFKSLTNILLVLLFVSQSCGEWSEEYTVLGKSLNFRRHDIVTLERERRDTSVPAASTAATAVPPSTQVASSTTVTPTTAATPSSTTSSGTPAPPKAIDTHSNMNPDANKTATTTEKTTLTSSAPAVTQHLLGVNGTGTRKDVVSNPINPEDNLPDMFKETPEKIQSEHNLTKLTYDNHDFYNSSFIGNVTYFNEYWANISKPEAQVHTLLSSSYRRANTIQLSFPFPYYGHYIRNVTLATGGFMFIGEHVHNWIAATQYIAPLMGNFDTSLDNESFVKLSDDGEKFTVFWENVTLRENHTKKFTFACTLYKNGDIVFAYKTMPMEVQAINDQNHPVKVGISDAYVGEKNLFNVRSKTIYEYHRVTFKNHAIVNNTILRLTALPTCIQYNACDSCLNHNTGFNCTWCPQMNKCSSGTDINKQNWKIRQCPETSISEASACPPVTSVDAGGSRTLSDSTVYTTDEGKGDHPGNTAGTNPSNVKLGERKRSTDNLRPEISNEVLSTCLNESTIPETTDDSTDQYTYGRIKNEMYPDDVTQMNPMDELEKMLLEMHEMKMKKDVEPTLGTAADKTTDVAGQEQSSIGGAVAAFFIIAFVSCFSAWVMYAFKNPHTRSGQLLIKYRPSQWNWRRGEARYTAATIHM